MKKIALFGLVALAACGELSEQTLSKWKTASESAKNKLVAERFADNAEYVKKCITRMAALPNTEMVKIQDAGRMCLTGLRVRETNAPAPKVALIR
ncbi:MAG: hypothetical protein LBL21_03930 [Rickettsiales bacterium]|jgi:hypothetical protein|nr:hypothetical protein [Rickettsiales bacterium]